jgi:hypothetical protein
MASPKKLLFPIFFQKPHPMLFRLPKKLPPQQFGRLDEFGRQLSVGSWERVYSRRSQERNWPT